MKNLLYLPLRHEVFTVVPLVGGHMLEKLVVEFKFAYGAVGFEQLVQG